MLALCAQINMREASYVMKICIHGCEPSFSLANYGIFILKVTNECLKHNPLGIQSPQIYMEKW